MTIDHAVEARAALELADTYREDGAFQSADRCQREGTRHLLFAVLEQLPSSQLIAEFERLQQQIARLTEQADLWHRGELDTTTAMAGICGELHGVRLPEVGEWDRHRAAEQTAVDRDEGHGPTPFGP